MGRNKEFPSSAKKVLSLEAQIIKVLMQEQPLHKDELRGRVGIGRTQLWRTMELLKKEDIVSEGSDGFVLFGFSDLEVDIATALREFKAKGFVAVGIYDLGNEIGRSPSAIEAFAFKIAKLYGMKIESVSRMKKSPIQTRSGK